jgi:ribonuclease BN (tRNA processing enzyme)
VVSEPGSDPGTPRLAVTVLGCSGSFPTPASPASGYLVQSGGTNVWLDAGSGTLANLQRHIDPDDLDGIVLTHAHPDHWTDVLGYYVLVGYFKKREGVPVYSPTAVRKMVAAVHDDVSPQLDWTDITATSKVSIGALAFSFSRTDHPGETLAVRVDAGGRSLGYSADTGPAWSISELGPGLDLAMIESSFTKAEERTGLHLSARQAGISAKAAGVPRLLLTHLQPWLDPEVLRAEAEESFGGPVEVAVPNERYEV